MKKYLTGAVGVLVVLSVVFFVFLLSAKSAPTTLIGATAQSAFQFEIVRTPAEQERGLGGRAEVPAGYGMLFVFPEASAYSFWMKDMLVPIDILWLRDDGTILGIEDSVSPDTYPATFTAPAPVRLVLELKAGEARRQNIHVGTRINLPANWQK